MTQYSTDDGRLFEAATALEVVQHLRTNEWVQSNVTHAEFMRDMADRIRTQTGMVVDTTSAETFVAGLLATGLLKKQKAA